MGKTVQMTIESRLGRKKRGAFYKNGGGTSLFTAKSWGHVPLVPSVPMSMKAEGLLAVLYGMFYDQHLI